MTDTVIELVEKLRSGDEDAFAALVKSYTPYVYRTAFALLHDRIEAEDVAQEAFLKVHRSISQLKEGYAFHSWFTRIITNICLDRLKKWRPIPVPEYELNRASPETPEHWDQRIVLQDALNQLSAEYREVLVLRDWQGYDYLEIAGMLGIPLGTVKSRIHTARMQLKKILAG